MFIYVMFAVQYWNSCTSRLPVINLLVTIQYFSRPLNIG